MPRVVSYRLRTCDTVDHAGRGRRMLSRAKGTQEASRTGRVVSASQRRAADLVGLERGSALLEVDKSQQGGGGQAEEDGVCSRGRGAGGGSAHWPSRRCKGGRRRRQLGAAHVPLQSPQPILRAAALTGSNDEHTPPDEAPMVIKGAAPSQARRRVQAGLAGARRAPARSPRSAHRTARPPRPALQPARAH